MALTINTNIINQTEGGHLIDAKNVKGGYFVVDTNPNNITDTNILPKDTKVSGSLCYCTADKKFYQYNGSAWVEAKLGSSVSEGINIDITEEGEISLKDEIELTKVNATTVSTDVLETPTVLQDGDTLSITDIDGNMVAQIDESGIIATNVRANEIATSYIKYNDQINTCLTLEAQAILIKGATTIDGNQETTEFIGPVNMDSTLTLSTGSNLIVESGQIVIEAGPLKLEQGDLVLENGTLTTYGNVDIWNNNLTISDDMSNYSVLGAESLMLNCYNSDAADFQYITLDDTGLTLSCGWEPKELKLSSDGVLRYYEDEEGPLLAIGATNSTSSWNGGTVEILSNLDVQGQFTMGAYPANFSQSSYVAFGKINLSGVALETQYSEAEGNRLYYNGHKVLLDGDDYSGGGVEDGILNTETLSIVSKDTTIGTSLTTIATIDGIDIKAKVDSQTITQSRYAGTDGADVPILLGDGSAQNVKLGTVYVKTGTTGITVNPVTGQLKAGSFYAWSDRRLKENIKEYKPEKSILDLPVVEFDFKESGNHQIGCIAQDLQEICPDLVSAGADGYLSINENKLVYLLLLEVKKLREELNEFKNNERN